MYTGSCLCAGIRFRLHLAALDPIQICHCAQCRKAQGTPFASNTPVPRSAFELLSGQDLIKSYESTPGKMRCFCDQCGSPLYSWRAAMPDVLRIRVGLLDEPVRATLAFHAYLDDKCAWWPVDEHDGLPHYAQGVTAPRP
jgi:hypothetical protein